MRNCLSTGIIVIIILIFLPEILKIVFTIIGALFSTIGTLLSFVVIALFIYVLYKLVKRV